MGSRPSWRSRLDVLTPSQDCLVGDDSFETGLTWWNWTKPSLANSLPKTTKVRFLDVSRLKSTRTLCRNASKTNVKNTKAPTKSSSQTHKPPRNPQTNANHPVWTWFSSHEPEIFQKTCLRARAWAFELLPWVRQGRSEKKLLDVFFRGF